jgi:hypothetical protein
MALVDISVPAQVGRLAIFQGEFVANLEVTVLELASDMHKLTFGPMDSRIVITWVSIEFLDKLIHFLHSLEGFTPCFSHDSETFLVVKVVWVFGVQSVSLRVVKRWQRNLIKLWSNAAYIGFHFGFKFGLSLPLGCAAGWQGTLHNL